MGASKQLRARIIIPISETGKLSLSDVQILNCSVSLHDQNPSTPDPAFRAHPSISGLSLPQLCPLTDARLCTQMAQDCCVAVLGATWRSFPLVCTRRASHQTRCTCREFCVAKTACCIFKTHQREDAKEWECPSDRSHLPG